VFVFFGTPNERVVIKPIRIGNLLNGF